MVPMTRRLRALTKTPGYFALAVSALALGAGAATVMFSVTESVLWRALPFPGAERMVLLSSRNRKSAWASASAPLPLPPVSSRR
jgi:hypothetical protein